MLNNPILEKTKNLVFYTLGWLLLAAVDYCLLHFGAGQDPETAFIDALVFDLILAALGISFWYPARFISLEKSLTKFILSHITGGIFASIIWLAMGYYFITGVLYYTSGFQEYFQQTIVWRFAIGVLFYYSITSFYYLYIYYNNLQQKITQETELKNLVTEAELKTLKFQINPHFIFNSLNSMSALTTIDPDKARGMILKLADFLRFTLANNDVQKNTLSEELKNIKLYLDIEKIRFSDKFDYIEEVDEVCKDILIPNMILQPLFENAIKHAVYEALEKVILKLTCKREENYVKITLQNNIDEETTNTKGAGIGIQNIKNRLELIYSQPGLLQVKKEKNIFSVFLYIPV